jgi:hypothetical protein
MTDAEEQYHFDIDLVHLTSDQLVCLAALPHAVIGDRVQISNFSINISPSCFITRPL